ncbi:MAG: EAL domain-containing protein [Chromatiaceae bacterium]|nr:EAL domain-containing protein [Chromatiaceae bacterium]
MPGRFLQPEVTEGVLLAGGSCIDHSLSALSAQGVGIVMDDFGTGYASLGYLRRYPFDSLKIDRGFICVVGDDLASGELVIAAIAMAHGLGLTVVGEGVETVKQLEFLAAQNCDLAQGNLIGRPVPAESLLGENNGYGVAARTGGERMGCRA